MSLTSVFPANSTYHQYSSPTGTLTLVASPMGLHRLMWDANPDCDHACNTLPHAPNNVVIKRTEQQLDEYFAGKRQNFDLPLMPIGTTFQLKAWEALQKIPFGKTVSYGEQAAAIGDKKKARAIGGANGKNPISIIIPCHRVIGTNGKLTGFGGGLDRKAWLLSFEQRHKG